MAEYLHISTSTIAYQARLLGLSGKYGFSADDVKRIENCEPKHKGGKSYGTNASDLAAEMEGAK